ncbi:radical SAM protein [bacterium]|nr:radical SAM protein [bacterium]
MFNIPYQGVVIRPPSEANSLIFQITLGCSDNHCIFCPAYKDKKFEIKDLKEIEKEIKYAARVYPQTRRIFFADGDPLVVEQGKLVQIFELVQDNFPKLTRIGIYGSIKSLENKSVNDLSELKKNKLGIIYLGFETGDEEVYKQIKKYGSPAGNVETCIKIKEAGIKVNVTIILGLGGKDLSVQHSANTAKILNLARPQQIAALTLMVVPGTPLYQMIEKDKFKQLEQFDFLEELRSLIEKLDDFKCLFFSNHASNYYSISARFPNDKGRILKELECIIKKKQKDILTPDFMRGL